MGANYHPFALLGGAGFRVDSDHLILDLNGSYDNGRKDNADAGDSTGYDRGLNGEMYFGIASGWSLGGGARWTEVFSGKQRESYWQPSFGGNKDFFTGSCRHENCQGEFSMRIGVDYFLSGTDKQNGSHGPRISFFLPSPSLKRRLFFRESLGIYAYHDTVTDATNPVLTRAQLANRSFNSFLELTLMYRF